MNFDDYMKVQEYIRDAKDEAKDAIADYILSHPKEFGSQALSMCREGADVGIYYNHADIDQPAYSVFLDSAKATKEVYMPPRLMRKHMPKEETINELRELMNNFRVRIENRANEMLILGHDLISSSVFEWFNAVSFDNTRKYRAVDFFGYDPDTKIVTFRTIANAGPFNERADEFKIDIPSDTFQYYPTKEQTELLEMVSDY